MKIHLDTSKNAHENAARYYEEAKEIKRKIEGLEKAIEDTKKELAKAEKEAAEKKEEVKVKREKAWYEKFHWFFTSSGKLVIGGKSAQQNDLVFAKHMEQSDIFFHADIQGASAVILKDGVNASDEELVETAQFAASFSNAWKNGNASVDVYAVKKDQLSKHVQRGYIPAGAFAIAGERKWFKNTKLALKIGVCGHDHIIEILPEMSKTKLANEIILYPSKSGKEKGELAKYTKFEQLKIAEQIKLMDQSVGGIQELTRIPDALMIFDVRKDKTALAEAVRRGVKVIAVCDSNVSPLDVDYPIPANDDGINSIQVVANVLSEAIKEGRDEWESARARLGGSLVQSAPSVGTHVAGMMQK